MRITDFRGTYRLAREGHGPESWKTSCPFCNSPNIIEYAEHIVTLCPHWKTQRQEALGAPLLVEWPAIAKIIKVLGQDPLTALQRIVPSFDVLAQDEPTVNAIKQMEEALETVTHDDLKEWIPKVAQFLDTIHHKRRKMIDRWNNATQQPTTTATTAKTGNPQRKQLRITDLWSKAPATSS